MNIIHVIDSKLNKKTVSIHHKEIPLEDGNMNPS
jgi:hypothetical protein